MAARSCCIGEEDGVDELGVDVVDDAVETPVGDVEDDAVAIVVAAVVVREGVAAGLHHDSVAVGDEAVEAELDWPGEPGPERSLALLNGGAAIQVAGRAESLAEGVRSAERSIDSGAATDVLERWVAETRT